MPYTKEDTYKHSVLEVSQRINGAYTGAGDSLSDEEVQGLSNWLYWRLMEAWSPTPSRRLEVEAYDQAVWNLGMAAVSLARHELNRRSKSTGALFRRLASDDVAELLRRVKEETMTPGLLAFAVDELGKVGNRTAVVPTLLQMVGRDQPDVVREAAIVALSGDLNDSRVTDALRALASDEASMSYLREMAAERLADI